MRRNTLDSNRRRIGRTIVLLLTAGFVSVTAGGNVLAEGPKEVTVIDPVTVEGTVAVQSLDNPAFTAFQSGNTVIVPEGFVGVLGTDIAEVPEGTRLVIEYASVLCDTPLGNTVGIASLGATQRTSPSSSINRTFQIPLNNQGAGGFSASNFVGGLSTRIYSDRGLFSGGVTGNVLRASGTGETTCFFSIAGYTVPLGGSSTEVALASATEPPEELVLPYTGQLPLEAFQSLDGTVVYLQAP